MHLREQQDACILERVHFTGSFLFLKLFPYTFAQSRAGLDRETHQIIQNTGKASRSNGGPHLLKRQPCVGGLQRTRALKSFYPGVLITSPVRLLFVRSMSACLSRAVSLCVRLYSVCYLYKYLFLFYLINKNC